MKKFEELTVADVAEHLKSWNSFWAGEYGLGFGKFETRAFYTARLNLTHDGVDFATPDETADVEIEADFHTPGCEAWKSQDDWYNQYIDDAHAFPWELENSLEFQAVCAEIAEKIRAKRPAPPQPPLDVDKHGLEISDDSIRAVMEASQKLGWHYHNDELRTDVHRTAWLCYNGKVVWLDERRPCEIDGAWMSNVGGALTAQEICNLAFSMSNPSTDWPFAKP